MPLRSYRPNTPSQRHMTRSTFEEITTDQPHKPLTSNLNSKAGRNTQGKLTVRHRGGGHKRLYRIIDWKRDKVGVPARIATIEYDPNRSARIALLQYADGAKRYMLAPARARASATRSPRARTSKPGSATRCRCATSRSGLDHPQHRAESPVAAVRSCAARASPPS